MAKAKSNRRKQAPKVRIVPVPNRTLQLRYHDPDTGEEVRISTGTHDPKQAERERKNLLRRLKKGDRPRPTPVAKGKRLSWSEFRKEYSRLKQFRTESAREAAEVRLDICESIAEPRTVEEMATTQSLTKIQAELATTRSPHTVASYMGALTAALNWAHKMGWLPSRVTYDRIKTSQLNTHKGRPITESEFEAMLGACDTVCANHDPDSWKYLLRGLWHSGLRLGEALNLSWDDSDLIKPLRHANGCVVLQIPAAQQENGRDQTIPTTPGFANLLKETPEGQRFGFVFNPARERGDGRYSVKQAGHVISDIGRKAGVIVNSDGKPASAHDLRRSFGQRLADAGVLPRDLQAIMRHAQLETTEKYYLKHDAADQAKRLADKLVGYANGDRTQHEEESPSDVSRS